MNNMKAFACEFIGTFTLIFVGVSAIASNHLSNGGLGLTGIALAHGLAIAVMVTATGGVSGGHLNPAVSFGAFLAKKLDSAKFVGYVISQCLGALFAAFLVKQVFAPEVLTFVGMGTPSFGAGVTLSQALIMEIILTFFLVFVVFGSAIDAKAPKVGGLFIGLTVALDIMAGGPISGGAMNPARHFGPALMGGGLTNMWVYWVGPLVGGALASLAYQKFVK